MAFKEIMMEQCGYEVRTTFWDDFSIAEKFGVEAVKNTYNRVFNEWKTNVEYITELVLVLNWKIWQHNEKNETLALVYNDLWEKCDGWCMENLQGDDMDYFLSTTD